MKLLISICTPLEYMKSVFPSGYHSGPGLEVAWGVGIEMRKKGIFHLMLPIALRFPCSPLYICSFNILKIMEKC